MPDVGRTAPEKTHTQSVVFWKDANWTEATSRTWVENHGYYTDGLDETDTQYRWRQYDPDSEKFDYRNQEIQPNSISLVIGFVKDGNQNRSGTMEEKEEKEVNSRPKRNPIRCFEGTARPHEAFWSWRNAADGGGQAEAEMELNGYISEYSWAEDEITPKMFKDDLLRYGKGGPITIRLNSYGGDVIAASMMHRMIKDYPGKVTVQIDGIAASAATVVAVAGDQVRMAETAYFMIHDPLVMFFMAALNIEELSRLVSSLEAVKEGIINAYETKSGLSRTRLAKLMTDETWMDAQKAADLGFVDEVLSGESMKVDIPQNAALVNALRNYVNVPAGLLEQRRAEPELSPAPIAQANQKAMEDLRAEARFWKG